MLDRLCTEYVPVEVSGNIQTPTTINAQIKPCPAIPQTYTGSPRSLPGEISPYHHSFSCI